MNKWKIEYHKAFWEWWTVDDGERYFRCDDEADAKWLCEVLNTAPESLLDVWDHSDCTLCNGTGLETIMLPTGSGRTFACPATRQNRHPYAVKT